MGLDMYAYKTKDQQEAIEIQSWRKHYNLHNWMEQLYRRKGGTAIFNLVSVQLDEADLDALESLVKQDLLPFTTGYHFAKFQPKIKADDLHFISAAREALKGGYTVFYCPSW